MSWCLACSVCPIQYEKTKHLYIRKHAKNKMQNQKHVKTKRTKIVINHCNSRLVEILYCELTKRKKMLLSYFEFSDDSTRLVMEMRHYFNYH